VNGKSGFPKQVNRRQQGFALLVIVLLALGVIGVLLVTRLNTGAAQIARNKSTDDALQIAADALVAYAAGRDFSSGTVKPGTLPCPDLDDDGRAEVETAAGCGNAIGSTFPERRIGRLPWKTLGLTDLRDSSGERLWYVVSSQFKARTAANNLNPTMGLGTITLRNSSGVVIHDGTSNNAYLGDAGGAAALIIAPGDALIRQGAMSRQDRSCSGGSCSPAGDTAGTCTSSPASLTAKCNPANYLDIALGEDNANFVDNNSVRTGNGNGFIQGPVVVSGAVIVNDRIVAITQDRIMVAVQKRIASEAMSCLRMYATLNRGRYPWPAPVCRQTPANSNFWSDHDSVSFGRIAYDSSSLSFDTTSTYSMANTWGTSTAFECNIANNPVWWDSDWKMHVFYAVADAYKPAATGTGGPCTTSSSCLQVQDSGGNIVATGKHVAVIVAGRPLNTTTPAQVRGGNNDGYASNYLEVSNKALEGLVNSAPPCGSLSPAPVSTACSPLSACNRVTSSTRQSGFNDVVVYYP
jgi:type II secretory pathway pseudopilin PulG